MSDPTEDDSFVKQRRNLLFFSVLIIALEFGVVKINRDISVFTESFSISKRALHFWLPVIFFYSWWRFWCNQGFKSALNDIKMQVLAHYVQDKMFTLANKITESYVRSNSLSITNAKVPDTYDCVQYAVRKPDDRVINLQPDKFTSLDFGSTNPRERNGRATIKIPKSQLVIFWVKGILKHVLTQNTFSELVLPHFLAITALTLILIEAFSGMMD